MWYLTGFSYIWLVLIAIAITGGAQMIVKHNYKKYAQIRNTSGKTGAEVAKEILMRQGLSHVQVVKGQKQLSDHYNPKSETVCLSPHVYEANSIAAASIAAHECGHAVQHAQNYAPLSLRSMLVPAVNFVNQGIGILILLGFFIATRNQSTLILDLAIIGYLVIMAFQVVTLPVEFNASHRAMEMLADYNMVSEEDMTGTKKVLNAAALTYVAAMLATLLTIIRLLLVRDRRR